MYYFSYFYFSYGEVDLVGWQVKHTWKILSSNPTDGLGQDGLWEPHYKAPDNLQVGHADCVSLTILYPLFFLCISKVLSKLHHSSVVWYDSKEYYSIRFSKGGGAWQHLSY